ncbi:MAG: CxxxxCH/CxxCH domain-containing protein [Deltaproteobacteria bacterium]|nr:CxxxxCH/CxxCH domain-containing protein [Deltaproteobacteria bacterium]
MLTLRCPIRRLVLVAMSIAACGKTGDGGGRPPAGGGDADLQTGGDQAQGDPRGSDDAPGDLGPGDSRPGTDVDTGGDGGIPGLSCVSCHGNALNAAPPLGLGGKEETTATGVGAHQSHLRPSDWHQDIACEECHLVPQALGDVGHIDTPRPAEVIWGGLAEADNAQSAWDRISCDTYCHGQTLAGGTHTEPEWTKVGLHEADCGNCHGLPPPFPHPAESGCFGCHGEVIAAGNQTFAAPELHVDGTLQVVRIHTADWGNPQAHGPGFLADPSRCGACHGAALDGGAVGISCEGCHGGWQSDCAFCHGGSQDPAPPEDVAGSDLITARGVGAHQSHLKTTSAEHRLVVCDDCHLVPATLLAVGHIDTPLPAELTWSSVAATGGAAATFDGESCTGGYCHGASLVAGGSNTAPAWGVTSPPQASCGTCHALPPNDPHPQLTDCNQCHAEVIAAGNATFTAPAKHVDGVVQSTPFHVTGWAAPTAHGTTFNGGRPSACTPCHGATLTGRGTSISSCDSCHAGWKTNCVFCHGGVDNQTGAPPEGVDGETTTTTLQVGAHSRHVVDTLIHSGRDCSLCHVTPTDVFSPTHLDDAGTATVTPSGLASGTAYAAGTGVCSNNYCHGDGQTGRSGSADWNAPGQLDCGSCHDDGTNPLNMSGEHDRHVADKNYECYECHAAVVDINRNIIDVGLHVNGARNIQLRTGGTWNAAGNSGRGACDPACHNSKSWY